VTDTLERVDTSSIEALDFEHVCEVRLAVILGGVPVKETPCDRPAAWAGNYPCCGHLAILCDWHIHDDPTTFWCTKCNNEFTVDKLISLRPLK
jgi:hypothetical protein